MTQASHVAMCGGGGVSVRLLHRSSRMCFERSPKKDNDEKAASASRTDSSFKLSSSLCDDSHGNQDGMKNISAIVKSIMSLEADEVDSLNRLLRSAVKQEEEEVRYYEKKVEQALAKTFKKEKSKSSEPSRGEDVFVAGTTNVLSSHQNQSPVDPVAMQAPNEQQTNEGVLSEPDHDFGGKKTAVSARKLPSEVDRKCDATLDSPSVKEPGKEFNKTPRTLVVEEASQASKSRFKSRPLELGDKTFKTVIKTAETQKKESSEESAKIDQPNHNIPKDSVNLTSSRTIKGSGFILKKPERKKTEEEIKLEKNETEKSTETTKIEDCSIQSGQLSKDSVECRKEAAKSKVIDQANINFPKDVIRLKPKRIFNLSLSKKKAESTMEKKVVEQAVFKSQMKKKNELKKDAKPTSGWWFWRKPSDDKDPSDKK